MVPTCSPMSSAVREPETQNQRSVGLTAMRQDWSHFCRVAGASRLSHRLGVLFSNRSFWALAVLRYGQWAYRVRTPILSQFARAVYQAAYLWGQHHAKVAIDISVEVHHDVYLSPIGLFFIGPGARLGPGCRLGGQNTLGWGGRPGARGVPRLGDRVRLGPGATLVGPITVCDDVVVGPNAVVVRDITEPGYYAGNPARKADWPIERLDPEWAACPEAEGG
jgi:serine O-acetyltransferase